jgi:transposase
MKYSNNHKDTVVRVYKKLKSYRLAEEYTGVPKTNIHRWFHLQFNFTPKISKLDVLMKQPVIIDIIKTAFLTNPFYTVDEIKFVVNQKCNHNYSYNLIYSVIKNMRLSYKKVKIKNYINRDLLISKTNLFSDSFKNLYNKNTLIISLDEVGFNLNLTPIRSWSPIGKPYCIKNKIKTNKRNKSVISYITSKGNIHYEISDTPFNTDKFLKFLKTCNFPKNTIILMDNVAFHKSKICQNFIKNKEWKLLYTPPYSPWFNPIENIFFSVKHYYRKHKNIKLAFEHVNSKMITNTIDSVVNHILKNDYVIED